METILKLLATIVGVDMETRTVTSKISTQSVDRDGDVMIARGCVADDFLKSRTVFFNHDYEQPIGKNTDLQIMDDHVLAKTRFADRPDNHPASAEWFPDTLLSLFKQGVISSFSVGFQPVESRKASYADKKQYGSDAKQIFTKWKLLEYSVAPLASNPDALAIAISKAVACSVDTAKSLVRDVANPASQHTPVNDDIEQAVNKALSKHLETVNKTVTDAIDNRLKFGPGSKLHMDMYDIVETVVKCVMDQGLDGFTMSDPELDDDHDDTDQVSPELEAIAASLEKHLQTSGS